MVILLPKLPLSPVFLVLGSAKIIVLAQTRIPMGWRDLLRAEILDAPFELAGAKASRQRWEAKGTEQHTTNLQQLNRYPGGFSL